MDDTSAAQEAASAAPLDVPLELAVFSDVHAKTLTTRCMTWAELVDFIADPEERASKDDCELLKLATFGDRRSSKGSLRSQENLLRVFGVEGDYDAGSVAPEQAAELLEAAGVEALIYTTPSHTATAPRWRVLAPLSTPCGPNERARFVGMLNAAVGGVLAPESFKASQTYYFGRVKDAEYLAVHASGAFIDALEIAPAYPVKIPREESAPADDVVRLAVLERVDEDTITDLRSALSALDSDPYDLWTDVGQNLKALGEVGCRLWTEWSSGSHKFDAEVARAKWETFSGDRSDYRSVFTKANAAGWTNPHTNKAPRPEEFVDLVAQERDEARRELEMWDLVGGTPERAQELASRLDATEAARYLKRFGLKPKKPRFASTSIAELRARPRARWFVKHVLPKAEIGMLFGPSGVGKSFVTIDLTMAIARGVTWRDRKVEQARVAYVVAEGAGGILLRLEAYGRQHEVNVGDVPFAVHEYDVPNLLRGGDAADLAKQINAEGGAGVIVIDTLAQVTPGGNENSSEDMGKALAQCKLLSRATGALVLIVHHTGKDLDKGARGWSGLKGAMDVEIEVHGSVGDREIEVSKLKDGPPGQRFGFRLHTVVLGLDDDNEEEGSCIVEHTNVLPARRRKLGRQQAAVLAIAKELLVQGRRLSLIDLVNAVAKEIPFDPVLQGKRDKRRETVRRVLPELIDLGQLEMQSDAEQGEVVRLAQT